MTGTLTRVAIFAIFVTLRTLDIGQMGFGLEADGKRERVRGRAPEASPALEYE